MDVADPRQDHRITLAVLATAALAYSVQQTMVVPAISRIADEFGASQTTATWLLTGFLLTSSVATPILGRLGDMFGKEKVLSGVLGVFALGTLVCALSDSIAVMIAGRVIQGAAGGIFPLAYGIIRDEFPARRVSAGIGMVSAIFGVGGGIGLLLSGAIVDHLALEWLYWISLPVTLVALVCTHLFVPESPVRVPGRVDWTGAGLFCAGLVMVLLAITEGGDWGWTSVRTLGLGADGVMVLVLFVLYELRVSDPLVDMRMMGRRVVATTNVVALLVGVGMFGGFLLIPQFVQVDPARGFGFGSSVLGAAIFLLPSTICTLLGAPLSGWLGERRDQRLPLVIGAVSSGSAYLFLALAHAERWEVYVASALMGAGIGMCFAALPNLILADVRQDQTGVATGMNTIFRTVGGALGSQVAASIVAGSAAVGGLPTESGYSTAFLVLAGTVACSVVAAMAIPIARAQRPPRAARRVAVPLRR